MKARWNISIIIFWSLFLSPSMCFANYIVPVADYMSKKGVSPVVIMALSLAFILTILLIVYNEIRKADRFNQKKVEIGWQKFNVIAEERRIPEADQLLLKEILQYAEGPNVDLAFSSALFFENSLESFYSKKSQSLTVENYILIRNLREVLGFTKIPNEVPLTSSRQFLAGSKIKIFPGTGTTMLMSSIVDVNEADWLVSATGGGKYEKGDKIRLTFTRNGDAEYNIDTEIKEVLEGSLILNHTRKLFRQQLRNWVRVDVNFPCVVHAVMKDLDGNDIDIDYAGKIIDVSGGGASFKIPEKLRDRGHVQLSFDLPKHRFKRVKGVIARVNPAPVGADNLFKHSLEFLELETADREKIVRFVFDKQRQDNQWR